MKKILSIVLAALLALSCFTALADTAFTPAATYDPGERSFDAGVIPTEKAEGGSAGTVTTTAYAGVEGADYTDEEVYTYNDNMSAMGSGLDWNPHTWETSDDRYILDWNTIGFYEFVLNETKDGYSVFCEMASALPEDVTAQYVGSFGVEEGESAKAWRIALNKDACWDDGTPITADDYIYSMQQVLNPKMLNRRADSYYGGPFSVVNAKNYLYAGAAAYNPISDGTYASTEEALAAAGTLYIDMWGFWGLQGMVDENENECPQYVDITDEVKYRDLAVEDPEGDGAWISAKEIWEGYSDYFAVGTDYAQYVAYVAQSAEVDWSEVGLVKVDDYTIDMIAEKPVSDPAFNVPYSLSMWLVKQDLYEACKTYFDADGKEIAKDEAGNIPADAAVDSITTNYCTSVETSASYGPYTLTYYELDKQFTLERNENFYGWKDGRHLGQYQTDRIVCSIIAEQATQLMTFLKGELDSVALTAADMETYGSSEYISYTPQSYTSKFTFNLNYAKLLEHGTNSQVVVIDEFRHAFALCLDREEFATSFTAAHQAGYGMLNYLYVYDPFTGARYRDNEYAKEALLNTYDVTWGEGGEYETLDEAYDAMTGYNMEAAQAQMAIAYDKAVAAGIYDGVSPVAIEFQVYQNDTVYVQMFNYVNEHLQQACVGTGFEGKVSMYMTANADYYESMYSGATDFIYTTWGGSDFAPFTLLAQCYCDAYDGSGNQMEVGFNTEIINVTMDIGGNVITKSLRQWSQWCNNEDVEGISDVLGDYADYTYGTRCAIYAKLEECYLSYYATTPMYYRYVASMNSQKFNTPLDEYMPVVGFGSLRYFTYNYNDTTWALYVASGSLQY